MASYIAAGNGNFNTGATWKAVSANSLLDSEANNVVVATAASWTTSATFVPGAVEVDGVAVKLYARTGTTGTFKIELYNSTDSTTEGTCTVNCADFCTASATPNEGGWVLFTFAAHTLDAADNHVVRCQTSSATQITLYRNATAANISRMVRTTTAAASPPAAASIFHILEEKTSAGAATTRTVTMDAVSGAITKYGSGTDGTACITVSDGGTLNYAYAATTNYYLQLDGNLIVYNQGTVTVGTVANPIPRDGTGILEFDPTADSGQGLVVRNGGTFTAQGLSRTTGKNIVSCLLNTDEAVNQTTLGVNTDTGWLDNDRIAIASTSRTPGQSESGLLNGAASATELTVDGFGGAGGGLAYAHSGTSPTQAEVVNVTRCVKVRSTSSTLMAQVVFQNTAVVDIDWVEFNYIYYLAVNVTTGSCNIQYSSFWGNDYGVYFLTPGSLSISTNNFTFSYNVSWNCAIQNGAWLGCVRVSSTYTAIYTITYNVFVGGGHAGAGGVFFYGGYGQLTTASTFSNNTIAGTLTSQTSTCTLTFYNNEIWPLTSPSIITFSNNLIHSCSSGMMFYGTLSRNYNATFTNTTIYRMGDSGLSFGDYTPSGDCKLSCLTFDGLTIFGCTTASIEFQSSTSRNMFFCNITFKSVLSNGDSSFSTTDGIAFGSSTTGLMLVVDDIKVLTGDFGTAAGIKTGHTTDIDIVSTSNYVDIFNLTLNNVKLADTELGASDITLCGADAFIKSTKHDQTTGAALVHKTWLRYGTIDTDLTYYNTAVPSMRLTPLSAVAYTLESGSFKVNVNAAQAVTASVYVRKSTVASGGALYNGSQPRLVVKRNDSIGITADTVIDTMTEGATANWEQLTGATIATTDNGVAEFVVQCDGTAGFVNVDDFTATVA